MRIRNLAAVVALMFLIPAVILSQSENIDLAMIYKIKQEGLKNSKIEDLAYGLTDLAGPRLTASSGSNRGNMWAKLNKPESHVCGQYRIWL